MLEGVIATKATSRKQIFNLQNLVKDDGGVYKTFTECRETLVSALVGGNNLMHETGFGQGYLKLRVENRELTTNDIDALNNWLFKTESPIVNPKAFKLAKDNWIVFPNSTYCSIALISTVALILRTYFKIPQTNELVADLLEAPYEIVSTVYDAYFTAYYIWATHERTINNAWYSGRNSDGPASFVPHFFYYQIPWHKYFYQNHASLIENMPDQEDLDMSNDYWQIVKG